MIGSFVHFRAQKRKISVFVIFSETFLYNNLYFFTFSGAKNEVSHFLRIVLFNVRFFGSFLYFLPFYQKIGSLP